MVRLIDADALDELLKDCIARYKFVHEPIGIIRSDEINAIRDLIKEQMPTVDAVPVVRCKDCIYGTEMSGNIICHQPIHNEYETDIRSFDWFCADGERRGDYENNSCNS